MHIKYIFWSILNNEIGSFGPDIEDLLQDIGTVFTIIRDSGNITGEKLLDKINRQVTKPFIREFFIEAAISYASSLISGDIIEFDAEKTKYLTVTVSPRHFENQAFDKQAVMYKCNVSGELLRLSGEAANSQTYRQESIWDTIRAEHVCAMTEEIFGNFIDQDESVGQVENKALIMYFPSSIDVQPLDRYVPISGEENYKIEEVERFRFPGVHVAHLEVDTRE